jgi:hypothetical protein
MVFYEFSKDDLIRVIAEVTSLGKVLGAFNATFLNLILKKGNTKSFEEFKIVSFFHCVYKILTKIFIVRIKRIFLEGISKEQFGFLEGRQIHDVIGVHKKSFML